MLNNLIMSLPLLFGNASGSADGSTKTNPLYTILMMVALFAIMYFVMIRPQKKRQKEEQELRDSIQIGDEITTIGGIMGRIVTVKDDSLVIETGSDRIKMKITRWAVQTNNTAQERIDKEKEALKKAQDAEKEARKQSKGGKRKERTVKDESFDSTKTDSADSDKE